MSDDDKDRDLRDSFARLRASERARAPSYGAVRTRAVRARPRRLRALTLAAASAAAAVAVTWATLDRGRDSAVASPPLGPAVMGSVRWEAPTDFLLRTSGGELLRTVPSFGGAEGWEMLRTDTRRGRRPTPDTVRDQGRTS